MRQWRATTLFLAMMSHLVALTGPTALAADHDPLCGGYCTFLALKSLNLNVGDWEDFARRLGRPGSAGFSLGKLAEVAAQCGGQTLTVQTSLESLRERSERFLCVAHLDGNHYVLLYDAAPGLVKVVDAPFDYEISAEAFQQRWDGRALLIARDPLALSTSRPWRWSWGVVVLTLGAVLTMSYAGVRWARRRREHSMA